MQSTQAMTMRCRRVGGGINKASNDEVERRGVAPAQNEGSLFQSSTPSLTHRKRGPAIARTDC
jgi:hypothetical protein